MFLFIAIAALVIDSVNFLFNSIAIFVFSFRLRDLKVWFLQR